MKLIHPIIPENLILARELRNYTGKDFSEIMGVSRTTLSNWENGNRVPDFGTTRKISSKLRVPYAFLTTPQNIAKASEMAMYRTRVAVPKKMKLSFERSMQIYEKVIRITRGYLSLPEYKLENINSNNHSFRVLDDEYIVEKANQVRKYFQLGDGPISNIAALMERAGIQLAYVERPGTGVHALTEKLNDDFFVLLNVSDQSAVRIRFSLAHELGHIILHSGYGENVYNNNELHKRLELEANFFAGCLLLPKDGFLLDVVRPTLGGLIPLKPHWLVSIQTMAVRLNQLNIINGAQETLIFKEISRKYSRQAEPFDFGPNKIKIEKPAMINSAVKFAEKNNLPLLNQLSKCGFTTEYLSDLFPYLVFDENGRKKDIYNGLRVL